MAHVADMEKMKQREGHSACSSQTQQWPTRLTHDDPADNNNLASSTINILDELSPVQQTPTSLTPNTLTMEGPLMHLGDSAYRPPSFPDLGSSESQPRPENIDYLTATADLNIYGHVRTESIERTLAPVDVAANMSSWGVVLLSEGLPVQPRALCPNGSGFVTRPFVSQPAMSHGHGRGYLIRLRKHFGLHHLNNRRVGELLNS